MVKRCMFYKSILSIKVYVLLEYFVSCKQVYVLLKYFINCNQLSVLSIVDRCIVFLSICVWFKLWEQPIDTRPEPIILFTFTY